MGKLRIQRETNMSSNADMAESNGATKGVTSKKGRRSIFKKKPSKYFKVVATRVPSGRLSHQGSYLAEGDIVSVVDSELKVYYAQIRGLFQNQLCEKFAVITWLIPTRNSPKGRFDPATYIIGPEEDTPRSLDCFEFVCHAPNGYFKAEMSSYPKFSSRPQLGFILTEKGPKIVQLPHESNSEDD